MHHRRLLIIDDSPAIHTLVKSQLGGRFEILSSYDGATGLAMAAEQRPEIILLDLDLPGVGGSEACERLKANPTTEKIPVLVLSAQEETDVKVRVLDAGAADYLSKPFDSKELAARVEAALRARRAADEAARFSMVDRLTGLFDRRYFELQVDAELARSRRWAQPLGCLLIGIDGLPAISLQRGKAGLDRCVAGVGEAVQHSCRRCDVACRFAEDEFAVLALGADAAAMQRLAERVGESLQRGAAGGAASVRVSMGFAVSRFSGGRALVLAAREALRLARRRGGGCIVPGQELLQLRLAG
jgi:diguanylate cyclase (GGDEF)-like protein